MGPDKCRRRDPQRIDVRNSKWEPAWITFADLGTRGGDEAGDHWFIIEADDRFVWWAEVHLNSTPDGVSFN